MSRELVLVKLGGSLITDKMAEEAAAVETIGRLAGELAAALAEPGAPRVLIGHGSGSFGHRAAAATELAARPRRRLADLGGPERSALAEASARTQDAAARLHRLVTRALLDAGVPVFSLCPSSLWWRSGDGIEGGASIGPLQRALGLGLVPVSFGDVLMDDELGASICSTEEVLAVLAGQLTSIGYEVRRALWLGTTPGILGADGRPFELIDEESFAAAASAAGSSAGVDVTGGMRLRLESAWELARRGIESWIVDGRRVGSLLGGLLGEPKGTRVARGARPSSARDASEPHRLDS